MRVVLKHCFSHLEITSLLEWKSHVLNSTVPVIVQFHADWSEPSKSQQVQFSPLYNNSHWNIAQVNIDLLPSIVEALEIKKVPTLYIVNKGRTVEKIVGNLPQKKFDSLVSKLKILSGEWTDEDYATYLINSAFDYLEKKSWDDSIEKYQEALKVEKCLEKFELTCWVGLAKSYFLREDYENAEFYVEKVRKKYLTTVSKNAELNGILDMVLKRIGDKRENNRYKEYHDVVKGINQEIYEDPYNNEIHARLATIHYEFGFIEEAIAKAIQIIESEGTLRGLGYKVLMEFIQDLGPDNHYVMEIQPKLKRMNAKYKKL